MTSKNTTDLLADLANTSADGKPGGDLLSNLLESLLNREDTDEQIIKSVLKLEQDPILPPGSIRFGENNLKLGSATRTLEIVDAYGMTSLIVAQPYDDTGIKRPVAYSASAVQTFPVNLADDQTLTGQQTVSITAAEVSMTIANKLKPASAGQLRIRSYTGTDDTGSLLVDSTFEVTPADVGNEISFVTFNPSITATGDEGFITFDGIDLLGGVSTLPGAPVTPFLESTLFIAEKKELAYVDDIPVMYGHRGDATPDVPIVITQSNVPTLLDTYTFTLEKDQTIKLDAIIRWSLNNAQSSAEFSFTLDGAEILASRIEPKDPNNEDYLYIFGQIDLTAGPHTVTCVGTKIGNGQPDLTIFSNGWTRIPVIVEP